MRFLALLIAMLAFAAPAQGATTKARTTACLTSVEADERAARFEGDMRTVAGAVKLQMRFTLQTRSAEEPEWTAVKAPGFGSWNSSAPGIGRFVYVKTVQKLLAPASYRAVVHFRWLGLNGKPILRAKRHSRVCRQPDLRPDLVATDVVRDGDGYAVTLANEGRHEAQSFAVTLEHAGRTYALGRVARLAAGARATLRGTAPECQPGDQMTVRVDPDGEVDEADEMGNELIVTCPGPIF